MANLDGNDPKGSDQRRNRRRFLFETIQHEKQVPYKDLKRAFPGISNQAIHDDIQFFKDLGMNLEAVPSEADKRERIIVDTAAKHDSANTFRQSLNPDQKKRAASLAASVIAGFPEALLHPKLTKGRKFESILPQVFSECLSKEFIISMLEEGQGAAQPKALRVKNTLLDYWREMKRSVAIDSGTTSDRIGELLVKIPLPLRGSLLSSLNVCTNSLGLFNVLGAAACPIRVTFTGGELLARSETVVGSLAEVFLKCSSLHFGISIVGCTMIDLEKGVARSDSYEEASMKGIMYERSALRAICIDHTKLQPLCTRASYSFAEVCPEQIDLIMVNEPFESEKGKGESINAVLANFYAGVAQIRERGVPVLISPSDKFNGGAKKAKK